MQSARSTLLLTRLIAFVVIIYGLVIILDALTRQLHVHHGNRLDLLLITVPQIAGLGFMYLGGLLLRRKYNAWLAAIILFAMTFVLDVWHMQIVSRNYEPSRMNTARLLLPLLIMLLLFMTRGAFKVRSDMRTFQQALQTTILVLVVAFLYGMAGFALLDDHDFHHEISSITAAHYTIDQLGLTTDHPVAHTRRSRFFLDSLTVISFAAVGYAAISFFEPIRMRLINQTVQREHAAMLLEQYPSDIDDYFKIWPHDKLYHFDKSGDAGLCYHVTRGVALVVGNPFGNPKHFKRLLEDFLELCFVNDWLPTFIHVDDRLRALFESHDIHLQKIGEEAILDLNAFEAVKNDKYFRQIRNRFEKLGYTVEQALPPHSAETMMRIQEISQQWLSRPGRSERGFMLGYFDESYLQACTLVLLYDNEHHIQGFMNLVPTFESHTANYDLLRNSNDAPGNANDYLVMGAIELLKKDGKDTLNLGLCPLAGVDAPNNEESTLVDQALRFLYANGDRFYSFSGLHRFKSKYRPTWEPRFVAYPGGVRNFTRSLTALNRAMKLKK